MRSMKLLVATAMVAALVAGPVLAQDADGSMAPASGTSTSSDSSKTTTTTTTKKHHSKKKHTKKSSSSTSTDSTSTGK